MVSRMAFPSPHVKGLSPSPRSPQNLHRSDLSVKEKTALSKQHMGLFFTIVYLVGWFGFDLGWGFVVIVVVCFETWSHYVVLMSLELPL